VTTVIAKATVIATRSPTVWSKRPVAIEESPVAQQQQQQKQKNRRQVFLHKWNALSPQLRRIALRRIVARRSFPRAAHLAVPAVPAAAEEWLQESGELPSTTGVPPPSNSAVVVGGDENIVVLDAPSINAEELKVRDARIAMRLLMSQHFRVAQRPAAEESRLRRQKYEEVSKPLLERDYQKRLNMHSEEVARWKRSPRSVLESSADAYCPEKDERVSPIAPSASNAFGSSTAERGFMRSHYEDDHDDASLFYSHPPALFRDEVAAGAQTNAPLDDGSVLLQPPASHLTDSFIPIRMHVDEDHDFKSLHDELDADDDVPLNRRDRGA
jgi:hypothetical protein